MRKPVPFLFVLGVAVASLFLTSHRADAQARCGAGKLCIGDKTTAVHMKGPVYFEADPALADAGNAVFVSGKGHLDYDFPSLGGASAALDTVCAQSASITVSGAKFGDTCSLGIDQAPVNAFGTIVPFVTAANTVKLTACASGITDGGSFDMPDASYTVRCTR